mgnify:CR=1 FL=1
MSANEMICRLFQARTAAHMAHLQTRSYAQHVALNGFYDDLIELTDSFAETYQGIFGIIEEYPPCPMPTGVAADWIDGLRQWLKKSREACCKGETALENIHDEVQALCASTVYKLRFLDSGTHSEAGEYGMLGKW